MTNFTWMDETHIKSINLDLITGFSVEIAIYQTWVDDKEHEKLFYEIAVLIGDREWIVSGLNQCLSFAKIQGIEDLFLAKFRDAIDSVIKIRGFDATKSSFAMTDQEWSLYNNLLTKVGNKITHIYKAEKRVDYEPCHVYGYFLSVKDAIELIDINSPIDHDKIPCNVSYVIEQISLECLLSDEPPILYYFINREGVFLHESIPTT
jgi:hypothetical protein